MALLRASSYPGCLHQTYQQAPGHDSKPPATIRHLHPTWCEATHSSPLCQPPGSTAAITHCLGLETQGTLTRSPCPSPILAEIITNLVHFTVLSTLLGLFLQHWMSPFSCIHVSDTIPPLLLECLRCPFHDPRLALLLASPWHGQDNLAASVPYTP